jgi:prepilin-type N-terminal cleavage/methylation domain-containing protein
VNERGFSLLEVLMTLGVLAFVSLSIATGIGTSHRTTRALEEEVVLLSRGQELLERLLAIPFGVPSGGTASGGELSEVFDDDDEFGSITLHRLKNFGPAEFEPAGFPVHGRWRVLVDADLNGDGDEDDPDEGRADLLRIVVTHDGRMLARTVRFDPQG